MNFCELIKFAIVFPPAQLSCVVLMLQESQQNFLHKMPGLSNSLTLRNIQYLYSSLIFIHCKSETIWMSLNFFTYTVINPYFLNII